MSNKYRDFAHFHREVLRGSAGPMSSAAEEVADEMYHQEFGEEFEMLWDDVDEE